MKRVIIRDKDGIVMIDIKQKKDWSYPVEYQWGVIGKITIITDNNKRINIEMGRKNEYKNSD